MRSSFQAGSAEANVRGKAGWPLTLGAIGVLLFLHVPFLIILMYAFTTD